MELTESDVKPVVERKSSLEILSELFGTFNAEAPVIVKKEKTEESSRKHKKSKKKHKHKDKKQKKKSKKKKRHNSSSSDSSDVSGIDITELLIKKEFDFDLTPSIKIEPPCSENLISNTHIKVEPDVTTEISTGNKGKKEIHTAKEITTDKSKIVIQDLKNSSIFDETLQTLQKREELKRKVEDGELSDTSSNDYSTRKKAKKSQSKGHENSEKRYSKDSKSSRKKEISPIVFQDDRNSKKSRDRDVHSHKDVKDRESRHKSEKHRDYKSRDYQESRHREDRESRDSRDGRDHRDSFYRGSRDNERGRDNSSQDNFWKTEKSYDKRGHRDKRENPFYKEEREENSPSRDDKWFLRDRYRGYYDRKTSSSSSRRDYNDGDTIDKKKLLEIARKNAIQMIKSGSLPEALQLGRQAQEKVISAIRSGGKTVGELTDFCRALSKQEENGDLSSLSEDDDEEREENEETAGKAFHHPFQIKERPLSITMNIKNSVPLPIKSTGERATELRIQFPVSSGQQHRKTESEWVPVVATTTTTAPPQPVPPPPAAVTTTSSVKPQAVSRGVAAETARQSKGGMLAITAPVVGVGDGQKVGPQVFPTQAQITEQEKLDVTAIVTQRLTAMRKLQENPNDVQAITEMRRSQNEMNFWAESKQQIGQFTGSTGVQILSQAELSSGYQAWARKDQLQTAAPLSGGMGMHLLQKMGWKPGEGLGKEKTGQLEPLLLEVKLDKKGIVAKEEQKRRHQHQAMATPTAGGQLVNVKNTTSSLQGKHPVSLLGEYTSKRKLGAPAYKCCFECGPDHKKNFLFEVTVNGVIYKPNVASGNKKEAKALAATICLQQIGLLPTV